MPEPAKRALFILASDPVMFPPTMNAAGVLADHGWRVDMLGVRIPDNPPIRHPEAVRLIYLGDQQRGFRGMAQYAALCRRARGMAASGEYRWIFAYDMGAVLPAWLAARAGRIPWLYHNHDLMTMDSLRGFMGKFQKQCEVRLARHADIVSFPQAERAEIFRREAKLISKPLLVFNCPRRSWAQAKVAPPEALLLLRRQCESIAVYQGCLGYDMHRIIEALPYCQRIVGLCLAGKELEPGLRAKYLELVDKLSLQDRVVILPVMPYDEIPGVTRNCDIGIGKLCDDPEGPLNDYYLAGASNKMAEYMAFGLPILAADTPINRKFLVEEGHGAVCHPSEPRETAAALDRLLDDPEFYSTLRNNNRRTFEQILNYDAQFEKILACMEENGPRP